MTSNADERSLSVVSSHDAEVKQSLRNFKLYPRTFKKKSVSLKLLDYTVIHVSTDSLFCKWRMAHFESLRTLLLESLILYVASNRMKVTSKKYQCEWWWIDVDIYLRPVSHSFINDCCCKIIPDIQTMPLVTEKNITSKSILAPDDFSFQLPGTWEELHCR